MKYIPRIADDLLSHMLDLRGAVLIEGIKWCGKSTTASQKAQSIINLSLEKERDQAEYLVYDNPEKFFSQTHPLLIDEWQKVPQIWDALRAFIDKSQIQGEIILTGSTSQTRAAETLRMHSGTGRIGRMKMLPMSLWESGDSNGEVSIRSLINSTIKIYSESSQSLEELAFLCTRGGWPQALNMTKKNAADQARLYVEELCESDIRNVDGHRRSAVKMRRILRSYARFSGSIAPDSAIERDINDISKNTVADYLKVLEDLFVINESESWNPNFRSSMAVQSSNTRYLTDPSIAVAALQMRDGDLLSDFETFGLIFETMVMRDLKAYSQALEADVLHYRDSSGLECDAVLHFRNGDYALIEVKLSQSREEEGANSLLKLKKKIELNGKKLPVFLMVISGTGYAHLRSDGVYSVPIGCLRP